MPRFDVIVLGLGAVGSAAAYQLARRGKSVLGIDRFAPPHKLGSSHGETRITRVAIGEGVEFSPLALRSHELWREIEATTGERLMVQCGCLVISGHPGKASAHGVDHFVENMQAAAQKYAIPHELFHSGADIRRRFPQFAARDVEKGFLDRWGGYLFPEACIRAQLQLAQQHGARLVTNTKVATFEASAKGARVESGSGDLFEADHLLITAGPWLPDLIGGALAGMLRVTRQVLHWFEIRHNAERFAAAANSPVFIWEVDRAADVYGFPLIGGRDAGIKIAHEEDGGVVDPDAVTRTVGPEEVDYMYETYVAPFLPDLGPHSLKTEVCLYTKTSDSRFIIDTHPQHDRVMFASACSGHGFKHSAAIGEALAEILSEGRPTRVDLAPFRLREKRLLTPT
jgi:sarcosine oxidase